MSSNNNHSHIIPVGTFTRRSPEDNRQMLRNYQVNNRTILVVMRYKIWEQDPKDPTKHTVKSGRTARVLLELPDRNMTQAEQTAFVKEAAAQYIMDNFNLTNFEEESPKGNITLFLDDHGEPSITIDATSVVMDNQSLLQHLGYQDLPPAPGQTRMYGYLDEQKPQHRSFRYMIEGCDMKTLQHIVPEEWGHTHEHECDRMCAYKMLADINTPHGQSEPKPKLFRPEEVNRWLNENGHRVGGLRDGVSSDDIQAHAIRFRYGHCAMDLSRSVLNLYIPFDRNHHNKTACYVVVGDHCQPIVDANIIRSLMKSATNRWGAQPISGYAGIAASSSSSSRNGLTNAEIQGQQQNTQRLKRRRSLDRLFKPEFDRSEDRILKDQWKADMPEDLTVEDWDDDMFSDTGSTLPTPIGGDTSDRRIKLPFVKDTERFHFYTKTEQLALVEEKCKPTYREGTDPTLIHYYICTDDDNVEFIYQYLIRVLKIDPLRYARSYNGMCRMIRMQNTWWCASKDIHHLMKLHAVLQPSEPFRLGGMATYAFRMLQQQLLQYTRKAGAIWECLSHYPPNLQRLMDTTHISNRPKLIQSTFNPPYSNPKDSQQQPPVVSTLIPLSQRRRVDLIRSYASTIVNLERDEQYPIHDPTNVVIPYDDNLHSDIPIGHYLVDIPTEESIKQSLLHGTLDDWRKLPCLPLGKQRMMSHRMLRALLHRGLLTKADIRLVCATDKIRQNRYGMALVHSLKNVVQMVYKHPELQDMCPKHLINHMVGLFNGTSLPHSGMRYVFHDIKHLYHLLVQLVSGDQLRRVKVLHTTGHDPLWHKSFDYYEIDTSGMSYRSFHLQPVYNMVLEDQAMRIFDVARPIPIDSLIQINIDAIEYQVHNPSMPPEWARNIALQTIDIEAYEKLTPTEIHDQYMGAFKAEEPKREEKAITYYYEFNKARASTSIHRLLNDSLVKSTEEAEWIPDWKAQLRVLRPEPGQSKEILDQLLGLWFTEEDCSGIIVTGAAGTGKTHTIRVLQNFAVNLGMRVVKTAYTHAACVQMGCDAVTLSSLFGMDEKSDLRCSMAISHRFAAQLRALDIDVLIIDEISMIPMVLLEVLMVYHRMSTKTRICMFGDFNQLPPVEPQWERPDDYNYFDYTDIFPYLVYDRIKSQPGRHLQLTECMRTTDPLLVRICGNPDTVTSIVPADFPMPPMGIPIWRFISWRNTTRKACNFYCMHRYLQMHPTRPKYRFILPDLYAKKKLADLRFKKNVTTNNDDNADTPPAVAYDHAHFRKQFDTIYQPKHWNYLQNYTYAVGMEVVCRNTMKAWDGGSIGANNGGPLECVNNRRGVLVDMDHREANVTIRWLDVIRRFEEQQEVLGQASASSSVVEPAIVVASLDNHDVTLSFHDFAFNFVPGFCITAHMAQGETIREHYGLLDWQEVCTMKKMAYVAVTRGSSSEFLHIVPPYAEPWNHTDTINLRDNILRKMFLNHKWDKKQTYEMDVDDILTLVEKTPNCMNCSVPLVTTKYTYKTQEQFAFSCKDSVSPLDCLIVCEGCRFKMSKSQQNKLINNANNNTAPVVVP